MSTETREDHEARLYADLTRNHDGSFEWNNPAQRLSIDPVWNPRPSVLHVVEALQKLGALSVGGLEIIHRVWSEKHFVGPEHATECEALINETIEGLIDAKLVTEDAVQQDVQTVYGDWQIPMYAIDTKVSEVSLADLQAAQRAELDAQYF